MGLNETVFGTPGTTTTHQAPGTRDPGFGFAKKFFNSLGPVMNSPYPTYQGNIDPGMSPTMQDTIRRAQGYAQSGPSEILQGAQGSLGRFMSPNFQNPYNSLFGGAANYGNVDPNQRIYGGQPAGNMTFQTGMEPSQGGGTVGGGGGFGTPPSGDLGQLMQVMGGGASPSDMLRMTAPAGPGGFPPGTTNIDPGNTPGPMGSSAAGMAPSVSAAMESLFRRPASAFDGNSSMPTTGSDMNVMPSGPTVGMPPPRPAWGSGGNARQGFQDFMGSIDKQFRGGSPSDYLKAQMQKNPGMDPMMPQGGAGTDWRKYWKALGRPGAPGGGAAGGRRSGPTDQGVAKPIPKKKPPYEVLTATTGR